MLDFLLKRYSNIEYVMNLDAQIGTSLIIVAIENDNKEQMYQKWLHDTARFEKSFEEYVDAYKPYQRTTVEERKRILEKYGGVSFGSI